MTEIFASLQAFLIGLAVFASGGFADAWSSRDFKFFGSKEAMKIFSDANGDFVPVRYATVMGVIAAALITAWIVGWQTGDDTARIGAVVIAFAAGASRFLVAVINNRQKAKRRVEQIRVLQSRGWSGTVFLTRNARSFYGLFRWIYSTNPDTYAARKEVNQKLEAFRLNPVFPK